MTKLLISSEHALAPALNLPDSGVQTVADYVRRRSSQARCQQDPQYVSVSSAENSRERRLFRDQLAAEDSKLRKRQPQQRTRERSLTKDQWALVLAGVSDFYRPAEKLSLTQNLALTATGAIWTRWCFVIKPRNILLAAVNFFLGCVGVVQVSRILMWKRQVKQETASGLIQQDAEDVVKTVKGGVPENPEAAAKSAIQ
ncbi:MAG: hypothetical protein Q9211_001113 [Gyalolechia sp. 1 TL-2023]